LGSAAAGFVSAKFHLFKTRLTQEQFQFQPRPLVRLIQNPVRPRRAAYVIHGVGPGGLFEVFIERAQQPEPDFSQCLTMNPSQTPTTKMTSTTAVQKTPFNRCMAGM
jgi:hypothetical protein